MFEFFSDLEQHLDVGKHTSNQETMKKSESLYDKIRKDWATKFTSVDVALKKSTPFMLASESSTDVETLQMGWALSKAHAGSIRFSREVKEYLTAKFEIGQRTGRKADPVQVEKDMRTATTPSNERRFSRTEWLTKTQIQSFFSRLAASKRKESGTVGFSMEQEDIECLVEIAEHQNLMANIVEAIGLKHPITYDTYDLCDLHRQNRLPSFNVQMLKKVLSYLEVPFRSKERKADLLDKLRKVVTECECQGPVQ